MVIEIFPRGVPPHQQEMQRSLPLSIAPPPYLNTYITKKGAITVGFRFTERGRRLFFAPFLCLLIGLVSSPDVHAWGRHGHQIIAETAALLASDQPMAEFLRARTFELGYYANVPDFMWKRLATFVREDPQHRMFLEKFDRFFQIHKEVDHPFALPRAEFDKRFPEASVDWGRAYWRIRELVDRLGSITEVLRHQKDLVGKERQEVQSQWLVVAGVLSHYPADLAMPLHVTENNKGQLTHQEGIHPYFEEAMVDQLLPALRLQVYTKASEKWPEFSKKNAKKTTLELIEELAASSRSEIKTLLDMDLAHPRTNDLKDARRYEPLIIRRMVAGSLVVAELYRRQVGWLFDDVKFFLVTGEPAFIEPGEVASPVKGPKDSTSH
ncbi:MAG: hypothetical protein C5B49_12325 [Bdellovibrio sp.]|nr:MAG: hypothetical protein C5B49_12325 [Bdellovibrio sp.]